MVSEIINAKAWPACASSGAWDICSELREMATKEGRSVSAGNMAETGPRQGDPVPFDTSVARDARL